jgi:hypothetical protein
MGWIAVASIAVLGMLALAYLVCTRQRRELPEPVRAEIAQLPMRRANQHVVDLELEDGRRVEKVWIAYGRFPAALGGRTLTQRYRPHQVVHARGRSESD